MKNRYLILPVSMAILIFASACNTAGVRNDLASAYESKETLYVYEDGKMKLGSRFVNSKDVVIYSDGKGGEKAAVKVYFPLHSDFYRDSIIVVRVVNKFEKSVAQQEAENTDTFN